MPGRNFHSLVPLALLTRTPGPRSKALECLVHVAVLLSVPSGMTGGGQLDRSTTTIYGYYMSTRKTTVYLDADAYRRLQQLAREQGRPTAALVREAVAEYADRHRPRSRPRSIGSMRSGRGDLAERAEEHLEDFGSE
jgi:predicted transcriptional regulator